MRILMLVIATLLFSAQATAQQKTNYTGPSADASAKAAGIAANRTNVKTRSNSNAKGTGTGVALAGGGKATAKSGDSDSRSKSTSRTGDSKSTSKAKTGDVDANQRLNFVDESESYNVDNSEYRIPAHADAGTALMMMQGCYGVGGVDARGAGPTSGGGLTLNVFKLTNNRCVLAAKALEAQANGNLKGYATMTCADKATWKGYRSVISAMERRKVRKNDAIRACVAETIEVALAMSARITNVEAKLTAILTEEGYDDEEIRRRLRNLEDVAHLPNKGFLINQHEHK